MPRMSSAWRRSLIGTFDAVLRWIGGVKEFEDDATGALRIERGHAARDLTLCDDTPIGRGSAILGLHFWNEHLPPFPSNDSGFDWAKSVQDQIRASLQRLALHFRTHRAFDDIGALRVALSFPKGGSQGILGHLLTDAGFEPIEAPRAALWQLFYRLEGIWAWLLTWAYNPRGLIGCASPERAANTGSPEQDSCHSMVLTPNRSTAEIRLTAFQTAGWPD